MPNPNFLAERLAMRGYRITASRKEVLRVLAGRPDCFTMDDVLRDVRCAGRATVFRTMRLLLQLDLVCRVVLEDGSLRYRLSARGHHHHLVCTQCGRVQDFSNCDVSGLIDELSRSTDYAIEGHWLEVYGRCLACRTTDAAAAGS